MAIKTIGTQKWSDTNLDVQTFQDGTPIAEISSSEQWTEYADANIPGWSYYEFDSSNGDLYGKLYNWYAVSQSSAICPIGFRIPTEADYSTLVTYLGGIDPAGYKMKNREYWLTLGRTSGNGSNESNFKANPGGYIKSATAEFWDLGWSSNFWTQTTASASEIISKRLYWSNRKCISVDAPIDMGLSVRLICTGSSQNCSDGDFDITNMF